MSFRGLPEKVRALHAPIPATFSQSLFFGSLFVLFVYSFLFHSLP
jgi:hypothetical protein